MRIPKDTKLKRMMEYILYFVAASVIIAIAGAMIRVVIDAIN